jgi:phospholipid/cholesterol/gamma-HCH transport system substrate-binding protein
METRASYIVVGSFVLILFFGAAAFAVWLGAGQIAEDAERYRIYFRGSVTGLQQGSQVRYNGIPVGSVESVEIDPDNVERVRVVVSVGADTPIKVDSEARLELQGITGGVFVQISGGTQEAAALEAEEGERLPVIPSGRSEIQQVIRTAPELVTRASQVLDRAAAVLSDENRQAVSQILADTRAITSALADPNYGLPAVIERTDQLIVNLDGLVAEARLDLARTSDSLNSTLTTVDSQTVTLSRSVRQLADRFTRAADQLNAMLANIRPGIGEFSSQGLYEFTLMVSELRGLAQTLSRLATRFERNPAQFLLGETSRGVRLE